MASNLKQNNQTQPICVLEVPPGQGPETFRGKEGFQTEEKEDSNNNVTGAQDSESYGTRLKSGGATVASYYESPCWPGPDSTIQSRQSQSKAVFCGSLNKDGSGFENQDRQHRASGPVIIEEDQMGALAARARRLREQLNDLRPITDQSEPTLEFTNEQIEHE